MERDFFNALVKKWNSFAFIETDEDGTHHLLVGSTEKIPEDFCKAFAQKLINSYPKYPQSFFNYPEGFMAPSQEEDYKKLRSLVLYSYPYHRYASFKTAKEV